MTRQTKRQTGLTESQTPAVRVSRPYCPRQFATADDQRALHTQLQSWIGLDYQSRPGLRIKLWEYA